MNNRRKKLEIVARIVVFILAVIFCHHIVKNKLNENKIINLEGYLFRNEDRKNYPNHEIKEYTQDASMTLEEVLAGFYKWDQLPLTKHFKDKFKYNRKNIIKNICDFERLSHYTTEKDGVNLVEITGNKPDNILIDIILPPIETVYVFKYNIADGKLDDVELIEKYNVDASTGRKFFEKDNPLKFEP